MNAYSEIAQSAIVKSPDLIEHPVHFGPGVEIHADSSVGKFTFINIRSVVFPNVKIGRYCSIARSCEIGPANHPLDFLSTHTFQYHAAQFPKYPGYKQLQRSTWRSHQKTEIGNDVWIGAQAIIKGGINVGDGAVIAANAVVTRDVPPYAIVGGSPARVIKYRFEPKIIEQLLALRWWELNVDELNGIPFHDIRAAITELIQRRGEPHAHAPCTPV